MVPGMRLNDFLALHGPLIQRRSLGRADTHTLVSAHKAGRVVRLLPGVYCVTECAADFTLRVRAVALWQADAVVTKRAAARITFWPSLPVTRVDVARCQRPPRSCGYGFEERTIDPDHVVVRGPVRLTAPALTAIDLIDDLGPDAIDVCLRSRAARLEDLWAAFEAHSFRAGNADRRRALVDSRDSPWSAAERLSHRILREAGLKGWVTNHQVVVAGSTYFIDIAFRGVRLAVEIDGRLHESDPSIFENDRVRQNALVRAGWTVLRFTYAMLAQRPEYVVATIVAELARLSRVERSDPRIGGRDRRVDPFGAVRRRWTAKTGISRTPSPSGPERGQCRTRRR